MLTEWILKYTIILTNGEKAFDKIQYSVIIKTPSKQVERNFFNIIKETHS